MALIPITRPNSFAISGISYPSLTRLSCLTFHDRRLTVGLSSMRSTFVFGQERGGQVGRNDASKTTLCKLEAAELLLPTTYGRLWNTRCFAPISSSHGG